MKRVWRRWSRTGNIGATHVAQKDYGTREGESEVTIHHRLDDLRYRAPVQAHGVECRGPTTHRLREVDRATKSIEAHMDDVSQLCGTLTGIRTERHDTFDEARPFAHCAEQRRCVDLRWTSATVGTA